MTRAQSHPWPGGRQRAWLPTGPCGWAHRHPEPVVIDGAGHLPNLEAERQFNEALRGFLQAHAPGGPPSVG